MVALKLDGGDRKAWLMTAAATGMTLLNRSLIGNSDDLKGARDLCRSLNLMKKQGVVGSTRL